MPPPDPAWTPPPQDWHQQQSFYPQEGEDIDDFQRLQRGLDEALTRESELLGHVQNLTSAIATFQQREDLHVRQLDVLTERVMDAEAQTASEQNALLEYQANCTELGHALAVLQDEIKEWENKCANLTARHLSDEAKLTEMMAQVKARNAEVEQFATIVEKSRLADERDRYVAERMRKKKQRGFFAWLFGIGDGVDGEEERLQELARSTLLRALQTERDNVHELEAILSILQQNNSAISEMVESRDELIDELNDRVAVFEEDKLVLKAALRQLQKEMADEAPKTQKLIDDLRSAREHVNALKDEVNSLIKTHQKEVSLLKEVISKKQLAINETESNLTMIGTYVDKLEERLASFAIARRDIEIREQMCNSIKQQSVEVQNECEILRKQAAEYAAEHDELKKLLEELVTERSAIQSDKAQLQIERDNLIIQSDMLRSTIVSLEDDVGGLHDVIDEWKYKASELESTVSEQRQYLDEYAWKEAGRERLENEALEQIRLAQEIFHVEKQAERLSEHETTREVGALDAVEVSMEVPVEFINEYTVPPVLEALDMLASPGNCVNIDDENESVNCETEKESTLMPPEQFIDSEPILPPTFNDTIVANKPQPPIKGPPRSEGSNPPHRRNVPLRRIRKAFSKATGIHGVFTSPSRRPPPLVRPSDPRKGS